MAKLIIHGGAGPMEGGAFTDADYRTSLDRIAVEAHDELVRSGARAAVLRAITLLESDEIFNAGTGSKLQRDGQIRMSAALIDSSDGIFSGVANIRNVEHPIEVADLLRTENFHVLDGGEATDFACQRGLPYHNPTTAHRLREYRDALLGETGTVGAVALDGDGTLCAGTSTGGVGYELPGRLGDTATVAGTYASPVAGVSCTGRGEDIVNLAVAARIVTRVQDGIALHETVGRLVADADDRGCRLGLISLDANGDTVVGNTAGIRVLFTHFDGERMVSFADTPAP
ncbi:MAG: isoaspartyl peptidase/L-asparaginase [Acidimicrobiales bacterium]